jgi:hypothetical protein
LDGPSVINAYRSCLFQARAMVRRIAANVAKLPEIAKLPELLRNA